MVRMKAVRQTEGNSPTTGLVFTYMTNDPEGKDKTAPDDEISEEILDDVTGGNDPGGVM